MPLSPTPLPRAEVGRPVTAKAWNALVKGVDDFYDALPTLGRHYLGVNVHYRQGAVPGARVVAVPDETPGGPPIEGIPVGDDIEFRLPAISPGSWTIHVQAPGFAAWRHSVDITAPANVGALAMVSAELTATHLFVPDLVGFRTDVTPVYLLWSGFVQGILLDANREWFSQLVGTVVLQMCPAGTAVPIVAPRAFGHYETSVGLMAEVATRGSTPEFGVRPPSRTIVPDLIGQRWTDGSAISQWDLAPSTTMRPSAPANNVRVVDQEPRGGAVVPTGTPLALTLYGVDAGVKLREFAGTHLGLQGRVARQLADGILEPGQPLASVLRLGDQAIPPWTQARLALGDEEVQAIYEIFDGLEVRITGDPGEGLAEAWQTLRVAAMLALNSG